jgi:putative ABC transport system ATP-binding protein
MDHIKLEKITPDFLEAEKIDNSGIWKQVIQFSKRQRVQVIAPSGSGKTSLIHFIYGMRKDYHGRVCLDGQDMRALTPNELAGIRANGISIIFQDLRLFPDHTAFENINIKRILQPYHGEERIQEMARHLGIQTKLEQLARTCSYGEQQRIAIIRAMQQPFDFLLMDEPFSHLDEENRKKAMELIEEESAKREACIILADLRPIEYFNADKVLQL